MIDKPETTPSKEAKSLYSKLRRLGYLSVKMIDGYLHDAYQRGYAAGHEDQMRARILDQQEYRKAMEKIDGRPVHY